MAAFHTGRSSKRSYFIIAPSISNLRFESQSPNHKPKSRDLELNLQIKSQMSKSRISNQMSRFEFQISNYFKFQIPETKIAKELARRPSRRPVRASYVPVLLDVPIFYLR